MTYSEGFGSGYNKGYARGIRQLEDKINDLEEVLYSVYKGERIAPWFEVKYDNCACRCKVHRKEREFMFTKAELLEAIDNIQKDSVT